MKKIKMENDKGCVLSAVIGLILFFGIGAWGTGIFKGDQHIALTSHLSILKLSIEDTHILLSLTVPLLGPL